MEKTSWEKLYNIPLTQNEGKVIVYRFVDRLTYSEIGRRMSLSSNRIRAIAARAIRKIRYQTGDWRLMKDQMDKAEKYARDRE